ncbi:MAG: MFS transporter [Rhodospirillaceae bacterium]|nr:MAG: MFS transporter [Rhodospirillaceae bacterium]
MTNNADRGTASPLDPLNWGTKTVMLTGGIAVSLTLGPLFPVLPKIDAALAHNPGDHLLVKLLVTVVGVTMVIGAPLGGLLTDRLGARKVLLCSCLLLTLAGTAGLYLDSLPALIASRLFVGAAGSAIAATTMTLINSRFDGHDRAKWMGAHVSLAALSGLILQPVSGLLGEFGWRWPFALYFLGLPLAAVALFGLGNERPAHRLAGSAPSAQSLLTWFPTRFAVLAVCIGSVTYIPTVYLPFLMRQAGVSSPFLISLVGFADSTVAAIMSMLYGKVHRIVSSHAAFAFSFFCTGTAMLITAIVPGVVGVVVGMTVFGLGMGWFVPNLMTAAAKQVTLDQQGRTVGLVKGSHYLAAPLCTIVVEPLSRQFGPESAMLAGGALSFCVLAVFGYQIVLRRRVQSVVITEPETPSLRWS